MGDCSYHGSREDCEGNTLYCADQEALNYDEYGSCRFAVTFDNDTLKTAVGEWIDDSASAEFKYGHISDWDVSQVTNMSGLFKDADNFNEDISGWDVSKVTDMSYMFSGASLFNQPLSNWNSNWNVSSVTDMSYMFENASEFNRSLKNWNVSSVENMEKMFFNASSFNSNITEWNVSGVTNMLGMFNSAKSFNQDISGWDVSNVEVMQGMFYNAIAFNKDISSWDISSVTNMGSMFDYATAFNSGYGNGFSITPSSLFWKINRCDDSSACNYMSTTEGSCYYKGRTDCDGNVLYCADPTACNYKEMGDCSYHGSRIDCEGNKIYCDDNDACNTGSMNECQYPPDGLDCEGNCDNPEAINYGKPGSCYSDVDTIDKFFEKYTDDQGVSYVDISTDSNGIKTYKLKNDNFEFNSDNINDWMLVNEILSDVVFNGSNKTITINLGTDAWEGLFKPKNISDGTFKIWNLTLNFKSNIAENCGGFISDSGDVGTGDNITGYTVDLWNCKSKTDNNRVIKNSSGGGIVGRAFNKGTLQYCYNNLGISWKSGGICGEYSGQDEDGITIKYCYCDAPIKGGSSGGIAGKNLKNADILYCYYTNTDELNKNNFGGISGQNTGDGGDVVIKHCYSKFVGTNENSYKSGGICGSYSGNNDGTVKIYNCYHEGSLNDSGCGGICGSNTQSGTTIINCYYSKGAKEKDLTSDDSIIGGGSATEEDCLISKSWNDDMAYATIGKNTDDSGNTIISIGLSWYVPGRVAWLITDTRIDISMGSFTDSLTDLTANRTVDSIIDYFGEDVDVTYEEIDSVIYTVYTLNTEKTITENTGLSIENNVIFDGNNKQITYSGSDAWTGLFMPADGVTMIIRNIKFVLQGSLDNQAGCILGTSYVDGSNNFNNHNVTIENCHTSGTGTIGDYGGGIVGNALGRLSSIGTIRFCSNKLQVNGTGSGGICGGYTQSVTIEYCWNEGEISGSSAGGICGDNAKGSLNIRYCYNKSSITGSNSGGIVGSNAGNGTTETVIFNCFHLGDVTVDTSTQGGITGGNASNGSGEINIYNCWVNGDNLADGFVGSKGNGTVNVKNCYYVGASSIVVGIDDESNTYKTSSWDDTYAYYTIGQGTVTDYTDVRWNNDNTTLWMIHNDGNGSLGGSFRNEYELSSTANADKSTKATMEELLFIFGDAIGESGGTYILKDNVKITKDMTGYFPIPIEDGITFDGGGNTITYEGTTAWEGLFDVVSGTDSNNKMTFTVQNINFVLNGADIANFCGGIIKGMGVQDDGTYDNNTFTEYTDITILNCHISSENSKAIGSKAGGIVGLGFCNGTGEVGTITNCSNTLTISGNAGGICGRIAANTTITYCWNEGSMSSGSGGICGQAVGKFDPVEIKYCYNTGALDGTYSGGICGRFSSEVNIFNCYNTGSGNNLDEQGGIVGGSASANSGTTKIYNCWAKGDNLADGFVGSVSGTVNVKNCYYIGTSNMIYTYNTYKTDNWDDTYAYYTIGQGTEPDYTDVRWNNTNVTEWIIHDNANTTINDVFGNDHTLGTANQGDAATWGDLEVLFGSAFSISGTTCTLTRDITIDSSVNTGTFPIDMPVDDSNNAYTFDGGSDNNYTITIDSSYGENWVGLFKPVADAKLNIQNVNIVINKTLGGGNGVLVGSGYDAIATDYSVAIGNATIDNCHVSTTNSITIGKNGGGLFGARYGYDATITISNCTNSLEISGENAGGICGALAGYKGTLTIDSCSNSSVISGTSAGGICGNRAGQNGTLDIDNCSNSGEISGTSAGGICGSEAGRNGTLDIDTCENSGDITGDSAGGICGEAAAYNGANVTISDCENSGTIGTDNGGICGPYASHREGTLTINECNNSGVVNLGGGGICGAYCCGGGICSTDIDSNKQNSGDVTITNCSNSGEIKADSSDDGTGAGGIVGRYAARGYDGTNTWTRKTLIIESCSNSGEITGTGQDYCGGGGICGSYAFYSNEKSTNRITNCSNTGGINGRGGGGICGSYCCNTGNNTLGRLNIEYCYSTGKLTRDHSGGIVGAFCGGTVEVKYCYYNYTTNYIETNYLGGIVGSNCAIIIFNCYSIFDRNGSTNSGGIAGEYFDGSIYNCYHKGDITYPSSTGAILGGTNVGQNAVIKNTYYIYSDGSENNFIGGDNNTKISNDTNILTNCYQTNGWDDTYAFYTIGQGTETNYTDVRWNNDNTTLWLIHNDGNAVEGSFAGSYTLGSNNDGDHVASMSDLLVIFSGKIDFSSNTYTLSGDVTISEREKAYFPIPIEDGITFDGADFTITYSGSPDWEGLFIPSSGTNSEQIEFTIQNINFVLDGANVTGEHGCILASSFDGGNYYAQFNYFSVTIDNCHTRATNSAEISGSNCGGICGKALGRSNTIGTITNCTNEIPISGSNAGGICGAYFRGTVTSCSNSGEISGVNAGGICGQNAGKDESLEISDCTNSGEISGHSAGGICGQGAGKSGTEFIIKYCSNTGDISGEKDSNNNARSAGGICGRDAGIGCSTFLIQYCWNEGNMTGAGTGGICGIYSGGGNGSHRIEYCYNSGDFEADNAGGICGRNTRNMIIFNCYNTGTIETQSYTGVGGIVGHYSGDDSKTTNIYNCYSNPSTSDYWNGTNTGGIVAAKTGTLNVYNSYYVYGNDDREIYGATPTTNSNTTKSSIWYEGYANKTINSGSNLSGIGKSVSYLKWYDSFDQAEKDDDFRTKFGDYITSIKVTDRPNQAGQTKYLEVGLRTKEGTMVDYAFGDATNGGDVEWDLSGENYFISDAPRIQLQSKTPSEKKPVTFTRVELLTTGSSPSDILVTTETASGGKYGSIWFRDQTSTEGYKVKVETNYRRGGSDWNSTGEPVDVIKNNSKGWHNDYANDDTTISFWRITIQDDSRNNMPNMNPWLITDDVSGWGGTDFEADQEVTNE